jgi:hypothetical protein
MRTENHAQDNTKAMRTGLITLGVLFLIALALMFIFLFRGGRLKRERQSLSHDRQILLDENLKVVEQRDLSRQEAAELRAQMEQAQSNYETELQNREAQIARLRARTHDIAELRQQIDEYEQLQRDYEELNNQHAQLLRDHEQLEAQSTELSGEYRQVRQLINEARPLRVHNINTLTRWDRWLWADRYNVSRARRVDETQINFEISGSPFTDSGNRNVYVNMLDPEGNIMYSNGEDHHYTQMTEVEFTGDPIPVEFAIDHPERLDPGIYEIQVYIDDRLARTEKLEYH